MQRYEYRVVPAPSQAGRVKGLKRPADRFAHALTELMNALGREGWEYVRADALPCEEKGGLLSRPVTATHHLLVFRRPLAEAPGPARRAAAGAPAEGGSGSAVAEAEAPAPSVSPRGALAAVAPGPAGSPARPVPLPVPAPAPAPVLAPLPSPVLSPAPPPAPPPVPSPVPGPVRAAVSEAAGAPGAAASAGRSPGKLRLLALGDGKAAGRQAGAGHGRGLPRLGGAPGMGLFRAPPRGEGPAPRVPPVAGGEARPGERPGD